MGLPTSLETTPFVSEISVDQSGNRILVGPGGPLLDGELHQLAAGTGQMGGAAVIDVFGVSRYTANGRGLSVTNADGSSGASALRYGLYGSADANFVTAGGTLAVSPDLKTLAVATDRGVELIHR